MSGNNFIDDNSSVNINGKKIGSDMDEEAWLARQRKRNPKLAAMAEAEKSGDENAAEKIFLNGDEDSVEKNFLKNLDDKWAKKGGPNVITGQNININQGTVDIRSNTKFCKYCGVKLRAEAKFCNVCGRGLTAEAEEKRLEEEKKKQEATLIEAKLKEEERKRQEAALIEAKLKEEEKKKQEAILLAERLKKEEAKRIKEAEELAQRKKEALNQTLKSTEVVKDINPGISKPINDGEVIKKEDIMVSDSDKKDMEKFGINPHSSDAMKRLAEARKDFDADKKKSEQKNLDNAKPDMQKFGINPYSPDAMKRLAEARKDFDADKKRAELNSVAQKPPVITQPVPQKMSQEDINAKKEFYKQQQAARNTVQQPVVAQPPAQQWNTKTYSAEDKKRLKEQFKQSEQGKQIQQSTDYLQQRWENSQSFKDVQAKTNSQGWKDMQAKMNTPKPTPTAAAPKGPGLMMAASMMFNQYKENQTKRKAEKEQERTQKEQQKALKDQQKAEKQRLKDLRKGADGGNEEAVNKGLLIFIILASLVIHYIDSRNAFYRVAPAYILPNTGIIVLYMAIALVGMLFVFKSTGERESYGIWVLVAALLVPTVLNWLYLTVPNEWMKVILGLAGWFPVLSLYLFYKYPQEGPIKLALNLYWMIWIFAGLSFILTSPYMMAQTSTAFGAEGIMINPEQSMRYVADAAIKSVVKASQGVTKAWNQGIAKATGQTYSSQDEEQRGIYLEDVRPVEPMYYTDSNVFVQAKLKAKNIQEYIPVRTTCSAPDTAISGTVTPEIKRLVNDEETYIDCHLGALPAGSHAVKLVSTFTFTTDVDIQYYFVDNNTRPELYKDRKIPERTVATSAGGPVTVGLLSFHQPMLVSSTVTNNDDGDYSFGVRLENKWTQGKIIRGNYYILEVPASVELDRCTRTQDGPPTRVVVDGIPVPRMQYKFLSDDNNLKEVFDSVTCRINIKNPADLFGLDIVAQETFKARVSYVYAIEQTTTVNVGTG